MSRTAKLAFTVLRVALGVIFIYASYHKIISPASFAQELNNYKLLPAALINPFAIIMPWLELFCGLALLANRLEPGASLLVALMMAAFTAAVASALVRGLNISCGCFKAGGSSATWMTFGRDVLFLAMAAVNLIRAWRKEPWNSPT